MKILALPNALKGSLTARQAGQIFLRTLSVRHCVRVYPIADGGDGFLHCFSTFFPQAKTCHLIVKNAFLKNKRTSFLFLPTQKTAVIETAQICGLGNTPPSGLDPLGASSYGVGQAIKAAIKKGATTIYVGLGGVACNDGGAGMLQACGALLTNKKGQALPVGAKALLQLEKIDLTALHQHLKGIKIIGIADVTNPLLGPLGSARVFGPQKGANAAQVRLLERALSRWAQVLEKTTGKPVATLPSAGAAGAIAAGLHAGLRARLVLGTQWLFQQAQLEKQIQWADIILTTEGKLDEQTFYGKAPGAVLTLAKKHKKPVLFICGQTDEKIFRRKNLSSLQIAALIDFAQNETDAKKNAGKYLARVCKTI